MRRDSWLVSTSVPTVSCRADTPTAKRSAGSGCAGQLCQSQGLQQLGDNQVVRKSRLPARRWWARPAGCLGVLQSSAMEDSNVDLTAELVNMIVAQRAYQANAQTIKTQDAILQTLVNLR